MRLSYLIHNLSRKTKYYRSCRNLSSFMKTNNFVQLLNINKTKLVKHVAPISKGNIKFNHTTSNEHDEEDAYEYPKLLEEENREEQYCRNILFKNSSDPIIQDLTKCASVEEVFSIFNCNVDKYNTEHLTQTILVLEDFHKVFHLIRDDDVSMEFINKLLERNDFYLMLHSIGDNLNKFNSTHLSYLHYNLYKLRIRADDPLLQQISLKIRNDLSSEFSIQRCAMFLKVIFSELSIRPYYLVESLLPEVLKYLDVCDSVEDLENLTICLNKLHKTLPEETLNRYREKLQYFLTAKKLTSVDYKCLLQIILFMNYPFWRNKNCHVISECILLMEDNMDKLNIYEVTTLNQVFVKNQEPGQSLNSIQRCSSRFLQSDEIASVHIDTKLKLFASLIYFASPTHRVQFLEIIKTYVDECKTVYSLSFLRKILSFMKVSDKKLCQTFWDKMLRLLEQEKDFDVVLAMCECYLHFNIDIDNYRHKPFESRMMMRLKTIMDGNIVSVFPAKLCPALGFALVYGTNRHLTQYLVDKLSESYTQLNHVSCLRLSQSLNLLNEFKDTSLVSEQQKSKVYSMLKKVTEQLMINDDKLLKTDHLLKANILRNDWDNEITETLLFNYKVNEDISSKTIETVCFSYKATSSLIPEVVNKLTTYVVKGKDNVLGFNAEKLLYLCYYLGYYPHNADEFFQTVTNIIIRDQERLSGLAFLHTALSLCFFNKLPNSFIKLVFNVEFLEKLDTELENCYSKDKYPQRVRNSLMQLNRAVCLEYPQSNVPWFHQKYVEEYVKVEKIDKQRRFVFRNFKENLILLLDKPELILENVRLPYGYHVDFVLNLNNKQQLVEKDSQEIATKLALLLVGQHAFTRFYIQLKGMYQMKKRHLEMLGYQVLMVNIEDWINLLYAKEKIDFISNLIWPEDNEKFSSK